MSRTTRKVFEHGNLRVTGICIVADIKEDLACATEPGKQEVFSGIARIDYRTNIGNDTESVDAPEWAELSKGVDLTGDHDNSVVLKARIKELEQEVSELKAERTELSDANRRLAQKSEALEVQNAALTEERDGAMLQLNPDDFLKEADADAST